MSQTYRLHDLRPYSLCYDIGTNAHMHWPTRIKPITMHRHNTYMQTHRHKASNIHTVTLIQNSYTGKQTHRHRHNSCTYTQTRRHRHVDTDTQAQTQVVHINTGLKTKTQKHADSRAQTQKILCSVLYWATRLRKYSDILLLPLKQDFPSHRPSSNTLHL